MIKLRHAEPKLGLIRDNVLPSPQRYSLYAPQLQAGMCGGFPAFAQSDLKLEARYYADRANRLFGQKDDFFRVANSTWLNLDDFAYASNQLPIGELVDDANSWQSESKPLVKIENAKQVCIPRFGWGAWNGYSGVHFVDSEAARSMHDRLRDFTGLSSFTNLLTESFNTVRSPMLTRAPGDASDEVPAWLISAAAAAGSISFSQPVDDSISLFMTGPDSTAAICVVLKARVPVVRGLLWNGEVAFMYPAEFIAKRGHELSWRQVRRWSDISKFEVGVCELECRVPTVELQSSEFLVGNESVYTDASGTRFSGSAAYQVVDSSLSRQENWEYYLAIPSEPLFRLPEFEVTINLDGTANFSDPNAVFVMLEPSKFAPAVMEAVAVHYAYGGLADDETALDARRIAVRSGDLLNGRVIVQGDNDSSGGGGAVVTPVRWLFELPFLPNLSAS